MDYKIDEQGKWEDYGDYRILIEPSEEFIGERDSEEQRLIDEELLDSLIPSVNEMLMAEVEIQIITILMEVGLI